jgi:TolA-binding protein
MRRALAQGMTLAALTLPALAAGETRPAPPSLAEVGNELERARFLPAGERPAALESAAGDLAARMKAGLSGDDRWAAHFLSGEIRYARGDAMKAMESFRRAESDGSRSAVADDAGFGAVLALEAAGKDAEAAKAWLEWEKKYPKSPLLGEARLARAWNALRRESVPEADRILTGLATSHPWMAGDRRWVMARATAAYLDDRADEALTLLQGGANGGPEIYLKALALSRKGEVLKAAAYFQEAADKSQGTPLYDHALLAKANTFLVGKAYRSAADEFGRVVELSARPEVRAEAELRHAASLFFAGDGDAATEALRTVASTHANTPVAARAQFLLGEVLTSKGLHAEAIVELNRVLTAYFEHELAASAQYRVGQCLDAMGRHAEATGAYQAVVSGYPLAVEAPAAAYLAGAGLLADHRPMAAVPYFQLVVDRYAQADSSGAIDFASPEHQELVEAALCLLALSYHQAENLGQLAGIPHVMLMKMPPSTSPWRAQALLIDADAMAAMGRHQEAQDLLATLIREFPDHELALRANRLLAWSYAREGKDDLAIQTEESMLGRYAARGNADELASAYLHKAHVLMNRKAYKEAATAYEDFLSRFPSHPDRTLALYQAGMAYHRRDKNGDAVDRWEEIVTLDPTAPIAEKAWIRAGDVYFQAEHYDDAKRCYEGLLANFAGSTAAARGMLRIAQCEYNAGRDAEALAKYSDVASRYPGTPEAAECARGIELALYRLGQKEDGAQVLAELVEKYPQSSFAADAQFQVAMSHYQKKEFPEAAEQFRRVVSQFPGFSAADRAFFLMADASTQAGNAPEARQAYEQFLSFFPESELRPSVQFRLGMIRFEEKDYMRAAVDFTALLETQPNAEMAAASLFNLALCQRMLGRPADATASLERYRAEYGGEGRLADVATALADIHDQAGRTDVALKELETALASGPSRERATEIQYRLGYIRERTGDQDGALKAYQKAMDATDKGDAYRLSALARAAAIFEGLGKRDRALAAYRDLIQHATDPELVAAAEERAAQLKPSTP